MFRRTLAWLEDRTGVESAVKRFLYRDLPASAGWHQVFGSVALFAFLVQVVTGILLALNYTPTPPAAYDSLRHIMTQVTAGRFLRALHHWGASLMIIVVVVHMIQAFLWGSYKKPREATWIAGVALLLLTLAFGLSGSLLPWDNRAYWGTVAITRILFGSGAVSLTYFYVAHVQILPLLTVFLIAIHLYLVKRHGRASAPSDELQPKKKYYPEQVVKETIAIFAWFAVLMAMALLARLPLGHLADPTDASYIPRPEWYFLFLKSFDVPLEVVGAIILPAIAIVTLLLVPFIDRSKMKLVRQRIGAIGLVILAAIFWGGLTVRALATAQETREMDMSRVQPWQEISASNLASIGLYRKAQCGGCHVFGNPGIAPDLAIAPSSRPLDWLEEHIQSSSNAPEVLTRPQVQLLALFVTKRGDKAVHAWQNAPQTAVDGALIYEANDCTSCHKLNGIGDELGPPLNGVGERHQRSWIEGHFADPPKYSSNSIMPAFQFKPEELKLITDYITAIPK